MEEIYKKLSAHMIKGLMVHDQLANYYDFLGLRGYKRCHEYHFCKESKSYRKLNRYYINHHDKLIPEMRIDNPEVIPESWYRYKRQDVDAQTKRKAVETGIMKWVDWETSTKEALAEFVKQAYDTGYVADAILLKKMLKDTDCELKYAMRKKLEQDAVNYDLAYIMQEQERLHDKYKELI